MRRRKTPWLLLTPFLLLTALLLAGAAVCIIQSFGVIPSMGLTRPTFRYFRELLESGTLLAGTGISLYISFVSSVLAVVFGVGLCYALVMLKRTNGRLRRLLTVPIMIPHLVVALFVTSLFAQSGLFARLLYALGLTNSQESFPNLLYTPNSIGIILSYLWKEIPFVCYFVLPLMGNIDSSLREVSANLGASRRQTFFHITLPLCMPAVRNAFFIILTYSFGAYELPFLLGATIPKALPVQAFIEYSHPDLLHRPYAMAINTVMLAVSLLLAAVWYFMADRGQTPDTEGGDVL